MSPRNVLRILVLGFTLVVLLVMAAAFVGYQGSKAIHREAQELVRGHFVSSGRGAQLEGRIVEQSQSLLDELETVLGVCLLLALGSWLRGADGVEHQARLRQTRLAIGGTRSRIVEYAAGPGIGGPRLLARDAR